MSPANSDLPPSATIATVPVAAMAIRPTATTATRPIPAAAIFIGAADAFHETASAAAWTITTVIHR